MPRPSSGACFSENVTPDASSHCLPRIAVLRHVYKPELRGCSTESHREGDVQGAVHDKPSQIGVGQPALFGMHINKS